MIDLSQLSLDQKAKAREKILAYQKSPQLFCKEVLGMASHWDKQVEIMESVATNRKTTVHSGHDVGKSFVAADIVLWFTYCFYPSIVITTAPTWRQVEKILWGEIANHWHKSKTPLGGKLLETEIKISPKHYAMGFSSDAPDAFQGYHEDNVLVVVDEPSGIEDTTFEQIESMLANKNVRLLLIGNPVRSTGYFAQSIKSKTFNAVHISCYDSPNVKYNREIYPGLVTRGWCEERRLEWGEDSPVYQSRVLGLVPTESSDTLIKLEWINNSNVRYEKFKGGRAAGTCVFGLDVARFGDCETVLTIRIGRRIKEIISYKGFDLMHTVGVVEREMQKYNPESVFIDDNGVGGGVTDRLMEKGHKNIVPVIAGAMPDDKVKYANRKSELAWRLREAFRQNEIDIPNHEKLVFQCNNQFYEVTKFEKLQVLSKTLLKKKGLKSPDFFDSLALTFTHEMPASLQVIATQYTTEFQDSVHVLDIDKNLLSIGVSRFMVMVPNLNGPTFGVWACADRGGMIYFYKERHMDRVTSGGWGKILKEAEAEDDHVVDLRYMPKIYYNQEELDARYNFIEQMEDHDFYFEEVDFNEDIAGMNLREGLSFDKDKPINNANHPFVLFHPSCTNTIRAVKHYLNPTLAKNNPLYEAAHKAVGTMILTEPIWLKVFSRS